MGNRLHYQSKHVVAYGPEEDFNHQEEEVYDLLVAHGVSVYADNTEEPRYADSFYVWREDLAHMLEIMNGHDGGHIEITSKDGMCKWSLDEVRSFFQAAYDNSEGDCVYFDWF